MRRRVRAAQRGDVPPRLLHYVEQEWAGAPGVDCDHPACAYWAELDRWNDEHPDQWPSVVADGPDVPFGEGSGHGESGV